MSKSYRISIITVVKNEALHLEKTIQSVIGKKKSAVIDYIIVDGGSTDGTLEVIRKYIDQISCLISEHDNGIYNAMNKGWDAAAADSHILFLGAGDLLVSLPDNVDSLSSSDVVYGSVFMGENMVFKPRSDFHLKLYNSLHHQALLVSKALHPAPPFDIRFPVYADFDFNQRLLRGGANFLAAPSFKTYALPGGISDRSTCAESFRVIYKNFGICWVLLAMAGFVAMRSLPFLKKMRPVRQIV